MMWTASTKYNLFYFSSLFMYSLSPLTLKVDEFGEKKEIELKPGGLDIDVGGGGGGLLGYLFQWGLFAQLILLFAVPILFVLVVVLQPR